MEMATMILTEGDRSRSVEVPAGSLVTVRLREHPTTGYRWAVQSSGGLELIGDRFEPGGAIGAAGIRVIEFRATRRGTHALRMQNRREWEGAGSAVGQFEATVVVK
jgi:inhibitor of cysteine peptidase